MTTDERGSVLVPFGGASHDWAAVELGAWLALNTDAPLRLAGALACSGGARRAGLGPGVQEMNDQGPLAGPLLEGYVPEELIGQGGMGEVYRALDVRLGRPVAPKVLAVGAVEDEGSRERLLRESRLAARLDHPNGGLPAQPAGALVAACERYWRA